MDISNKLIELIEEFEGFSSKPYLCPAGIPTIGYGATYYANGTKVTMKDNEITKQDGEKLLRYLLVAYTKSVASMVKVPITQGQFDALVDFAYNAGVVSLQKSTLLRKLNLKDYKGAADEFPKWVHGGGKVLPGLVKRRQVEQELFLKGE